MNKIVRFTGKGKGLAVTAIIIVSLLFNMQTLVSQDFSSYHRYDKMSSELKSLVNANKEIARIESIGKTIEGRDLWLVTIANQGGTPADERPAMFIGANFEGDHLIGSEISLSIINYLVKNYATDDAVRKSIDEHVYYIIPRMNPDGAEKMFDNLKSGVKTNTFSYDGDNDGRLDEDGPEDLNKDGQITMMRVKDGNGSYMIDKNDPRLMKKADPAKGEAGDYSVYWEGIDNDKDGFINEDPAGGVDINRNFQHAYPYFKVDAGWHMVSEKESLALMNWVIKQRNVAIMLNFGESDNLIVAPNQKGQLSSGKGLDLLDFADDSYSEAGKAGMVNTSRRSRYSMYRMFGRDQGQQANASNSRRRPARMPASTFNKDDLEYFNKASKKYKELTGLKTQPPLREPEGSFFQYGYFQYGVLSFSTPGWGLNQDSEAEEKKKEAAPSSRRGMPSAGEAKAGGIDKAFISYLDKASVNGFVEWESFDHPKFGEVEIGGFTPYEINNPPSVEISKLGEAHGEYVVWLSGLHANISIVKSEVIDHGGGIFRIKAEIENTGFLPTSLSHGVTSRAVKPTMVQLGVEPEAIISGSAKTSFFQALAGSGQRQKYEWLIKGKSGDTVELKVVSQKAGSDKARITLK